MSRSIEETMGGIFEGILGATSGCSWHYGPTPDNRNGVRKYMDIPIDGDDFEIPAFAMKSFIDLTMDNADLRTEAITAMLYTLNKVPRYKSLDRYMRDVLLEKLSHSRLVVTKVKQGDREITYYTTRGAVFDEHLNIVMLCSWLMKRVWQDEETCKYKFIKPVMYISPECFISQEDPMQRWIMRKAATVGLNIPMFSPSPISVGANRFIFDRGERSEREERLEVVSGKCHFKIRTVDVPSISTRNEDLLQLAIDHIEEVVTCQ